MLKIILLLLSTTLLVFCNDSATGASPAEIHIEGIDPATMNKLNDALKGVSDPEQRKAKVDEWQKSLPANLQPTVKTFFEKLDQLNSPTPSTPKP